jgi:hypothetical protein
LPDGHEQIAAEPVALYTSVIEVRLPYLSQQLNCVGSIILIVIIADLLGQGQAQRQNVGSLGASVRQ